MVLDAADRAQLLALARRSIVAGQACPAPAPFPALQDFAEPLHGFAATFVTLRLAGVLRGCRGTLEPERPVAHDVWANAWCSAYDDPRFPPLEARDIAAVEVSVSVLSALEPIAATTQAELLDQLEPGHDGILLTAGPHRATFLPQVWTTLPDPARFLGELLAKAGLPAEPWSPLTRAWRYTADTFDERP